MTSKAERSDSTTRAWLARSASSRSASGCAGSTGASNVASSSPTTRSTMLRKISSFEREVPVEGGRRVARGLGQLEERRRRVAAAREHVRRREQDLAAGVLPGALAPGGPVLANGHSRRFNTHSQPMQPPAGLAPGPRVS